MSKRFVTTILIGLVGVLLSPGAAQAQQVSTGGNPNPTLIKLTRGGEILNGPIIPSTQPYGISWGIVNDKYDADILVRDVSFAITNVSRPECIPFITLIDPDDSFDPVVVKKGTIGNPNGDTQITEPYHQEDALLFNPTGTLCRNVRFNIVTTISFDRFAAPEGINRTLTAEPVSTGTITENVPFELTTNFAIDPAQLPAGDYVPLGGEVVFYADGVEIGRTTLGPDGRARIPATFPAGTYNMTAQLIDPNYGTLDAPPLDVVVAPAATTTPPPPTTTPPPPTTSPTPTASPSPTTSPSPTGTSGTAPVSTSGPAGTSSTTQSPANTTGANRPPNAKSGSLAATGVPAGELGALALGTIAAGAVLLVLARRPRR